MLYLICATVLRAIVGPIIVLYKTLSGKFLLLISLEIKVLYLFVIFLFLCG